MSPARPPRGPARVAGARAARALAACVALLAACGRAVSGPVTVPTPAPPPEPPCCEAVIDRVAERHRLPALATRRFTHAQLWTALDPVTRAPAVRVTDIGRSVQRRPIRALTYGAGPTRVLLWSQMHGDESTATMALADLAAWLAGGDGAPADDAGARTLRRELAARLTLVMVPMLNPDGAEVAQRENAGGVDVNRDARRLATPEARALQTLYDSVRPAYAFNLHDQNARTLTDPGRRQVAVALLAPPTNAARTYDSTRAVARLLAAGIAARLEREVPGRVARYDDTFNPRAFGDMMQQRGTSTVLIESGALPDDPEKQRLRALNVLAILTGLDAIATGRYRDADPAVYDALPRNGPLAVDVLVRGARLVVPGAAPARVDVALNYDDPVAKRRPRVREVGELSALVALDTIDAAGLFLHPAPSMLTEQRGVRRLRVNAPALLTLRRAREGTSEAVLTIGDAPPGPPARGSGG